MNTVNSTMREKNILVSFPMSSSPTLFGRKADDEETLDIEVNTPGKAYVFDDPVSGAKLSDSQGSESNLIRGSPSETANEFVEHKKTESNVRGCVNLMYCSSVVLFVIAYLALIPGLTEPIVGLHGHHRTWSVDATDISTADFEKSTIDSVRQLASEGYWVPAGLIAIFSISLPFLKLVVLLVGEARGHLFKTRRREELDTRRLLRQASKFQMVDVFIGCLMLAFLDHDVITTELRAGFYYFLLYCVASILATQLLDASSDYPREAPPPSAQKSCLDLFLLFCSVSFFAVGLVWALGWPILSVRFVFNGSIVVGESRLSIVDMTSALLSREDLGCKVAMALVLVLVVALPTLHICLTLSLKLFGPQREPTCVRSLVVFLWEWSMLDVFAISLFTALFSFNAFGLLRANAPWGFYCVLMAGMSCFDLAKAFLPSILVRPRRARYEYLEEGEEEGEGGKDVELADIDERMGRLERFDSLEHSASFEASLSDHSARSDRVEDRRAGREGTRKGSFSRSPPRDSFETSALQLGKASSGGEVHKRGRSGATSDEGVNEERRCGARKPLGGKMERLWGRHGCVAVIVAVMKQLGPTFFFLKGLSWGIFFAVWYMNSATPALNVGIINDTLDNLPSLVNSALKVVIPDVVGNCASYQELNPSTLPPLGTEGMGGGERRMLVEESSIAEEVGVGSSLPPQYVVPGTASPDTDSPVSLPSPFSSLSPLSSTCLDKGDLYHDRSAVEIQARYLGGLRSLEVTQLKMHVPERGQIAMRIEGVFREIFLSLFIGQCLTPDQLWRKEEQNCDKLWDSIHRWSSVSWKLTVVAQCATEDPFVRNLRLADVAVLTPLKITEEIPFIGKIDLDDLADKFREGMIDALSPYLTTEIPWIPWGTQSLLNLLVKLNVDDSDSSLTHGKSGIDMKCASRRRGGQIEGRLKKGWLSGVLSQLIQMGVLCLFFPMERWK